ncbi:14211_t:CDS:1, partial [Funneliformis caledonium]
KLITITTSLESISFENLQKLQIELNNFNNKSDSNEQHFSDVEKLKEKLIENIKKLPVNQVKVAYYHFQNMRYTKRKIQGDIFSIYVQKKAIEFLKSELYKNTETKDYLQKKVKKLEKFQDKSLYQVCGLNSKITKLYKKHISKVRSYERKLLPITNTKF